MDLRVARSLELVENLKRTVAEFTQKEELLGRDLRSRRYTATRKQQDTLSKMDAALAAQIAEVDATFGREGERINALFERRRSRLQRAQATLTRNLPKRAKEAKGKWLAKLQLREVTSERNKETGLEKADAKAAEFGTRLEKRRLEFTTLEHYAYKLFAGYGAFLALLKREQQPAPESSTPPGDPQDVYDALKLQIQKTDGKLASFGKLRLPWFFRTMPLAVLLTFVIAGGVVLAFVLGFNSTGLTAAGTGTAVLLAAVIALHQLGRRQAEPAAREIASDISELRRLHAATSAAAVAQHRQTRKRVEDEYQREHTAISEKWAMAGTVESEFEQAARDKIEKQVPRLLAKNETLVRPKLERVEAERRTRVENLQREANARKEQLTQSQDAALAELTADELARSSTLEADWKREVEPIYQAIEAMGTATAPQFPPWTAAYAATWKAAVEFTPATKFAQLDLDLARPSPPAPGQLALPGPSRVSVPLSLVYPEQGSLLFETSDSGGATEIGTLNNIVLRLLATTPPGKLAFTIIDPIGLGQNFAGLMHLADYEESLINRRIWTQRDQIEERLAELNVHIEKVIQMYLRNEFATISEYNAQAGSVAEKYHFLVVADFPANFSDVAAKRLQSIAASGPRCGVFTLIHWDPRQPSPDGFVPDELRKSSVSIRRETAGFVIQPSAAQAGAALIFDPPPAAEVAAELVHKIGQSSIDSNRVEVPFTQIAPAPAVMWTNDTTSELKVAIGRTGATKLQYLAIGKGTRQHALFAGKTGSGKSTLFHVIITNLALACSPEQVEFYLIDFKKGVEFKCYATHRLPHARVVAIESDREFGLSVLQRVDEELKRRGDLFRKLGVQDIPGYKRAGGGEPMPRCLLLIDEFQEFFTEDDEIAQTASVLFDRIVRQGRAFGIHVLLGSQTLGGAFTLARATMGQMVIRVALQCNEADAYLIMDDSNSAPRLLSRPGEGIYNDSAGALEGNSPFQVVWLPDRERDNWLEKVRELAVKHHDQHPGPIVFEGNAPADLRENYLLEKALTTRPGKAPAPAHCWLGAPNSIKGPTEAAFFRQSGSHLLIVGQRDEAALTMLAVSLLSLAAQYPIGSARFVFFQSAPPGTQDADFLEKLFAAIPHSVTVARTHEVGEVMNELTNDLKARSSGEAGENAPAVFLFIHGLQRFKKLRHEDDFDFSGSAETSPGAQLTALICEGSSLGLHLLATVDTFNNVGRFTSRKALSEIEMRVVFQMSANDSSSLIDSPKASGLGLHRALLYNEHEGTLETFRPYATPDYGWLQEAAEKLAKLHG